MKKCFAYSLGECSGKISREHFISRSILELVEDNDGFVELGGPLNRGKRLPPNHTAVSRVLCEKHNSELSDYDQAAFNLIEEVLNFNNFQNDKTIQVDSNGLTLWIVKLILGYYAAQGKINYIGNEETVSFLVEMLFKKTEVPNDFGFSIHTGDRINNPPEMTSSQGLWPPWVFQMLETGSRVGGLNLWVYPLHFVFHFAGADLDKNQLFKPKGLTFHDQETPKSLRVCFV